MGKLLKVTCNYLYLERNSIHFSSNRNTIENAPYDSTVLTSLFVVLQRFICEKGTFICEGTLAHPSSLALRIFVVCSHRQTGSYTYI